MVKLFGQEFARTELVRRVGDISQAGDVCVTELLDGNARGVRIAEFRTGSGLRFTVLIDRGMDIGCADFAGRPVAWVSPTGVAHPAYHSLQKRGWMRTFHGGLMNGGGLSNIGNACTDDGEELVQHGWLSHTPASHLSYGGDWHGDEHELWVEGRMREAVAKGCNLVLTRRIAAWLGGTSITIEDRVVNEGFLPAPHQMLYHCNFGFPVISPDSELLFAAERTWPRDAGVDVSDCTHIGAPVRGDKGKVAYHIPKPDGAGFANAAWVNRSLGFGVYLRFRIAELPRMAQWYMRSDGYYLGALEPMTGSVEGRDKDRARGWLRSLEPGEAVDYRLEIGVLPDVQAIAAWVTNHS